MEIPKGTEYKTILKGVKNEFVDSVNTENSKNTTSDEIESKINGKSYIVNGVSIKLDKEDSNNKIKYDTSSSFNKNSSTTGYVYTIYKNKSEDKYDFSNITFRLDVSVDKMNTQSKIENVKASNK